MRPDITSHKLHLWQIATHQCIKQGTSGTYCDFLKIYAENNSNLCRISSTETYAVWKMQSKQMYIQEFVEVSPICAKFAPVKSANLTVCKNSVFTYQDARSLTSMYVKPK